MARRWLGAMGWLLVGAGWLAAGAPEHHAELIFPLDPLHNHSSCIVQCPNGDLLVCWYRGSGERRADDVRIMGARKKAGTKAWSQPFVMADTPDYPDCNPCLFIDRKERLWLFWPTILDHHWESAVLKYRRSEDYQGEGPPRWSWQDLLHITPKGLDAQLTKALAELPPLLLAHPTLREEVETAKQRATQQLYLRLGWMPRVHPLQLPDGKWLLPLYCDTFSIGIVAIANEDGSQWTTSGPILGFGAIQPALVRRRDGTLVAYMRENGPNDRIRKSESSDGGLTWGPVTNTELPNPGSSVDVASLPNGEWALIYNDTVQGRHSLAVSLSDDEGKTWKWTRHLERWAPDGGSASYPSLIVAKDGSLHATYSFREKAPGSSIKHARFSPAWIKQGD